jgi:hypothetical protein
MRRFSHTPQGLLKERRRRKKKNERKKANGYYLLVVKEYYLSINTTSDLHFCLDIYGAMVMT